MNENQLILEQREHCNAQNYCAKLHVDKNNHGLSPYIVLGTYDGGPAMGPKQRWELPDCGDGPR